MQLNFARSIGLAILVVTGAPIASSQQTAQRALVLPQFDLKTDSFATAVQAGREIQRVFDDPHLGSHWLLMRDPSHSGGPGLMVPAAASQVEAFPRAGRSAPPGPPREGDRAQPLPVIRTGDRLIVEEHTALVDARLEAVALGPAQPGSPLNVRLIIGGHVMRVVALSAGHVSFLPAGGARP